MRHHLLPMWVVLWTELGVRPSDVDDMTLDDALVIEIYAEEARRRQRRAAQQKARQPRPSRRRR